MQERFTTKRLTVLVEPGPDRPGAGVFEFTDDFSVFHFGKMPDRIPDKGEAICRMAAANLERLAKRGVPTHFRARLGPRRIEFDLYRVLDPARAPIAPGERAYFVPLQVVYRNALPEGASLFRRLDRGEIALADVGMSERPAPGTALPRPLIEYTTKLEETDRFIPRARAQALAALSDEQLAEIERLTLEVDAAMTEHARSVGLELADGKVEFAVSPTGSIVLVDVAGTPDENRFLLDGFHISKQVLRDCYLRTGLEEQVRGWVARARDPRHRPEPPRLPPAFVEAVADLYRALCERWLGERIFGAPELERAVDALRAVDTPPLG